MEWECDIDFAIEWEGVLDRLKYISLLFYDIDYTIVY